jgi:nicotinamide-nucleotide amidase
MPVAEIITIGTELLLGEIQDTNTSYIARTLNSSGIDIFHASIIGDNEVRIAKEIQAALIRADIVITTGGLGPTIDDPTRNAVALAFSRDTEFRQELWDQILARFTAYGRNPSENNKRQAYIPRGAIAISNPVGTAPAFYLEENNKIIFSLPGVPSEMKTLLHSDVLPIIKSKFPIESAIVVRTIHSAGIGESSVDELVAELEKMSNPTVGLAAHPGQVDIRITAKAENHDLALQLIKPVEEKVKKLLGNYVFGEDEMTLDKAVAGYLKSHNFILKLIYKKSLENIAVLLANWLNISAENTTIIQDGLLIEKNAIGNEQNGNEIGVYLANLGNSEKQLSAEVTFRGKVFKKLINYGGHPSLFNQWASNHILFFIREVIMSEKGEK